MFCGFVVVSVCFCVLPVRPGCRLGFRCVVVVAGYAVVVEGLLWVDDPWLSARGYLSGALLSLWCVGCCSLGLSWWGLARVAVAWIDVVWAGAGLACWWVSVRRGCAPGWSDRGPGRVRWCRLAGWW